MKVKVLVVQSCQTLCDPIDGSPLGSPVPGILQARILEWVTISFSNAWKWKMKVKSLSRARLLATQWTEAYQAPPSMGFSRQESWSGLPLPSLERYGRHLYVSVKRKWKSLSPVGLFVIPWTSIVHGIFQARILEWVAISYSWGSSQPLGSNPGLLHCSQILYQLSHKGTLIYQKGCLM